MTRAEFIQRAAIAMVVRQSPKGADEIVQEARDLANEVEREVPWCEDSIESVCAALHDIDKGIDYLANELPNAGRGS